MYNIELTDEDFQTLSRLLDVFIGLGGLEFCKHDTEFLRNGIALIEKLGLASGEFTSEKLERIYKEENLRAKAHYN